MNNTLQNIKDQIKSDLKGEAIPFTYLDEHLNQYNYTDDEKGSIYLNVRDRIIKENTSSFQLTFFDVLKEKIANKEYSFELVKYLNVLKKFSNKDLYDFVIYAAAGDDYDGCFTPRGEIEFYEAKTELEKRLKKVGFYG